MTRTRRYFGLLCALLLLVAGASPVQANGPGRVVVDIDSVRTVDGFLFRDSWLYRPGDDPAWADPALDDRDWYVGGSHLLPDRATEHPWTGIGWFRMHVTVDPALVGVPLGLHMVQAGASEIYLDGRLLYRLGTVGATPDAEVAFWDQQYPRAVVFDREEHVLAVRYSNYTTTIFRQLGYGQGFYILLAELSAQVEERVARERRMRGMQVLFTMVPLVFSLLHFFLFLFYRRTRENLYYALLTAFIAAANFLDLQAVFAESPSERLAIVQWASAFSVLAVLFGLRAAYSLRDPRLPKLFFVFLGLGLVVVVWRLVEPSYETRGVLDVYTFVALAEILRVLVSARPSAGIVGWVIGIGAVLAIVAMMLQLVLRIEVLGVPVYYIGVLFVLFSLSLYLSDRFASTNRRLELQLEQVRALTEKTLQQERLARELEFERRSLEVENTRKTQDLEAARQLQLSMLPKTIPVPPHLEVAAFMQTATEVGGDYYDFHLAPDGRLTIAIGDATGHGTAAGIIVAAVKSLFTALATTDDLREVFRKCTRIIKPMRLGSLFMALALVRIDGYRLTATSAGMPYPLLYRRATGTVEDLVLKGMPLGLVLDFPYTQLERTLGPGDALLLMSDGLPELFSEWREQFDTERVKTTFAGAADRSPEEIIRCLKEAAVRWRGERPARDDMTFVVVKVKEDAQA